MQAKHANIKKTKVGDTYWGAHLYRYRSPQRFDLVLWHWCLRDSKSKTCYPHAGETALAINSLPDHKKEEFKCKWCGDQFPDQLLFILRIYKLDV